jgi:diaminobutyrate-2-oxoglutarate transaminase
MADENEDKQPVLREPTPDDGSALWQLVEELGNLDLNSPYAYLLVGRHLASTSAVAEFDGELVAFVSAYRPPTHNDVLFVWQVGVHSKMQGYGLARKLLFHILDRDACQGVRWIETTVTPNNLPSQRLFRSLARHLDTQLAVSPYFPRDLFPEDRLHKSEELYRIGPIDRWQDREEARGVDSKSFKDYESVVRSYCRTFPAVFDRGEGHVLMDERGNEYLDFFGGAGALSYGHNEPRMRHALLDYLERGGVTHSLDMYSTAKRRFLERFNQVILEPRGMNYRTMFTGPTGTNAVEAALKLARKVTRRETIVSFTNGFHGVTLGSLALTGNKSKRHAAGVPLPYCDRLPYDGYHGSGVDTAEMLARYLDDSSSGVELPAAVIVETVQGEGGVQVASFEWLRRVAEICHEREVLLIVDDVQVGCGRTGSFFSFEGAGIEPDMVILSKALSGYGLPMAVALVHPEHDIFAPGEHIGTFRGHNLAMVTATAALDYFWTDDTLQNDVRRKEERVGGKLAQMARAHPDHIAEARGRGLIHGLEMQSPDLAEQLSRMCFEQGLIAETCGPDDQVLKLLPPLTTPDEALEQGLGIIEQAVQGLSESDG